jgi:hypothetical protein
VSTLADFVQSVSIDLAGLGLIGAGAFLVIAGHLSDATTPLALGGAYLGVKVANLATPAPAAPSSAPGANVIAYPRSSTGTPTAIAPGTHTIPPGTPGVSDT